MVDWYNNDWNCRKSYTIPQTAGAGTNYQVRIHVHYGGGEDDGEDVYLNGFCKLDFGDIRFTKDNGEDELPYWMDSKHDGKDAIFFVKLLNLNLNTGSVKIYLYYNKIDASTTYSGTNTFLYFDDFTGATISEDLTITEQDPPHACIDLDTVNDMLVGKRLKSEGHWDVAFASFPQVGPGYAIRSSCKRVVGNPEGNTIYVVAFLGALTFGPSSELGASTFCANDSTDDRIKHVFKNSGTGTGGYNVRELDTWQIIEACWADDYAEVLLDGSVLGSTNNVSYISQGSLYPVIGIEGGADSGVNEKHFDWVAVRKYVYPEPSGSWDSLEINDTIVIGKDALVEGYASKATKITSQHNPIIKVDSEGDLDWTWCKSPLIKNIIFEGNDSNTGILIEDIYACQIRNVTVKNCETGILVRATDEYAEGTNITHTKLMDVKYGIYFDDNHAGGKGSFAYSHIDNVHIELKNTPNCEGIYMKETSTLYSSFVKANIVLANGTSTGLGVRNEDGIVGGFVNLTVVYLGQGTAGTGIKIEGSTYDKSLDRNQGKVFLNTYHITTPLTPEYEGYDDDFKIF